MSSDPTTPVPPTPVPTRRRPRLSLLRSSAAVVVIAAASVGATQVTLHGAQQQARRSTQWFAPYVDVTLPPTFDFQDPLANPNPDVVLSFVVADPEDGCTPSWGAAYDLDAAAAELDLDRRIVRHRERGGDVIVSFGGVANDELAVACTDVDALTEAYGEVVDRYGLQVIDLDIEASGLDSEAITRRAQAIARVQDGAERLDVWLTLPVAPQGLTAEGLSVVDAMLAEGVDLAGVNIMTMEFGASRGGASFVDASLAAIDATVEQVRGAYRRAGTVLTPEQAAAKIGVTPMIGQNDQPDDRLDTDGARRLVDEASQRGITRFSMWSLNRDGECPANIDPAIATTSCSGVEQDPLEFSEIFGVVSGRPTDVQPAADEVAVDGRAPTNAAPGSGPYDDWRPRREYDTAEKVVWRGQVYEAKWWAVGAQPDAPVDHEWDSAWRILGPVLDEDAPPPPPAAMPDGTYPDWEPGSIYEPGDRVQHLGVGYRAKWWTRGFDPTTDVDNDFENPWEQLPPSAVPARPAPSSDV
ncbi:MAG TPA: carbohydrate-binding protein [Iamia sp.]|jgi:chitinase|nr:carbohydrate-binding protein [Iamia sp.]